jgi:hypothetical protein
MTWTVTSPITGGAQTGLTAPTDTAVADVAPDDNGKQVAVTALGGTQAGVTVHAASSPFTITCIRPRSFKGLGPVNPVTGQLPSVPRNLWKIIVRKGVVPLSGQPAVPMVIRCELDIPAGSDVADASNVRAAISALVGVLSQQSAGLGDSLVSGIF